jgi:hypothetical protein
MTTALVWRTPDRIPPFLDDAEAARVLEGPRPVRKFVCGPCSVENLMGVEMP